MAHLHQKQNRTVLVATHHFDEIEAVTDRIVRLRDGAVVEAG
jgi:ABC-type Na+ transport system ATPase subunit NatA